MQLVVAEKSSVGMALAKALGVSDRKDGYIEGCGLPVATSECKQHSEAPTEPTGETRCFQLWNEQERTKSQRMLSVQVLVRLLQWQVSLKSSQNQDLLCVRRKISLLPAAEKALFQ